MSRVVTLLFVLSVSLVAHAQAPAPKPAAPKAPVATPKPAAPKAAGPAAKPVVTNPPVAAPAPAAIPAPKPASSTAPLVTDQDKTIYALGLALHRLIESLELSPAEAAIVLRGLGDAAAGTPELALDEWGPKIDPLAATLRERAAERVKASSAAYLAKAVTEAGAIKTDSGLIFRDILAGIGAAPKASDTVKVHYRGTLTTGKVFDSSYERNEPVSFPLAGVIPCWTEGVQRMRVGGKAQLVCPSSLAYGDGGSPDIPGGAALVFEIELLEISAPGAAAR